LIRRAEIQVTCAHLTEALFRPDGSFGCFALGTRQAGGDPGGAIIRPMNEWPVSAVSANAANDGNVGGSRLAIPAPFSARECAVGPHRKQTFPC
jgi:hypothetical protein